MFCGAGQGRRQKSPPWPNSCPQASRPLRPRLRSSESERLPRRSWPRPPSVAVSAPGTPASLVPTNVAALIAIGPGVISAMATRSANSCRLSQLCCVTITYPPPNVNALRYSVERNSFFQHLFSALHPIRLQSYAAMRRAALTIVPQEAGLQMPDSVCASGAQKTSPAMRMAGDVAECRVTAGSLTARRSSRRTRAARCGRCRAS